MVKMLPWRLTWVTNMDWMPNLSRNVLAISGVGDLEAIATLIPLSLSAYNMPLALGNRVGVSSS
jgi:hypothetical protein